MMRERTGKAHQRNIALRLMILSVADSADIDIKNCSETLVRCRYYYSLSSFSGIFLLGTTCDMEKLVKTPNL